MSFDKFFNDIFMLAASFAILFRIKSNDQHSYQIISALALFVIMLMLEFQMPLLKET